jgi:hypothetical protein
VSILPFGVSGILGIGQMIVGTAYPGSLSFRCFRIESTEKSGVAATKYEIMTCQRRLSKSESTKHADRGGTAHFEYQCS